MGTVIAVDGGNSKTEVLVCDTAGTVLGYARGPGTNHQTAGEWPRRWPGSAAWWPPPPTAHPRPTSPRSTSRAPTCRSSWRC
ncbi:hypothetical protein ACFQV2_21710 [Actinokineospora soli]|uniref:FGGY family of carbohydrate kinases, N-terminal domain n=1 Tax=Actinokineospora soli TaxID=1048753 RepID=A0ABW2TPJ2_9PSEU